MSGILVATPRKAWLKVYLKDDGDLDGEARERFMQDSHCRYWGKGSNQFRERFLIFTRYCTYTPGIPAEVLSKYPQIEKVEPMESRKGD